MKVVIVGENNKARLNKALEAALYIVGYTFSFFITSKMFKSFKLSSDYTIFYALLAVILIYVLNKTIRPIIFKLTIPITALTFGLFYPFINFFILKLVDLILGDHFNIYGFWSGLLIAICISIMNFFVEELIVKPIIRRCNNE